MPRNSTSNRRLPFFLKVLAGLLVLAGALVFAGVQYLRATGGGLMTREEKELLAQSGPPTPEERRAIRNDVLSKLNLTDEQRRKIEVINARFDKIPEDESKPPIDRMLAIARELSPEQIAVAREEVRRRIDREIEKRIQVLPPAEKQKFLAKMDNRRGEWRTEFEQQYLREQQDQSE